MTCLLLVLSRRRRFTAMVLRRSDIQTCLLRMAGSAEEAPIGTPCFELDWHRSLVEEAARYWAWVAEIGVKPEYLCNHDEAAQGRVHAFAESVGLPHLTSDQVRIATDKLAMKAMFRQAGIPYARYTEVSSISEIRHFAGKVGWPVIVKPAIGGSSVDVWEVDANNIAELKILISKAGDRRWMAEEFIDGTEYQLCALVHAGVVLDTYLAANPVPMLRAMDGGLNADITLAPSEPRPVDATTIAQRIVDAIGYRDGYLHGELFVRGDGAFVMGEIAARMAGAELPTDHSLAYGFDMLNAVADLYVGRRPELRYTEDRSVGDLLLPARPGYITSISSLDELSVLPGVLGGEIRYHVGDRLDAPRTSSACTGFVHVHGPDSAVVRERMTTVLAHYRLEVAPS